MIKSRSLLAAWFAAVLLGIDGHGLLAQSGPPALSAPEARDLVVTHRTGPGAEKPRFWVARDDRTAEPLTSGSTFLGAPTVAVFIGNFNPLRLQVSVTTEDRDDESSAKFAELVKSISGIPAIVRPAGKPNAFTGPDGDLQKELRSLIVGRFGERCGDQVRDVLRVLDNLTRVLNVTDAEPEAIGGFIKSWSNTMDQTGGPAGIRLVRSSIDSRAQSFSKVASDAKKDLDVLDGKLAQGATNDACGALVYSTYQVLQLSDARDRVRRLTSLAAALTELAKALKPFEDGIWNDRDYLVASAQTESGKIKKVTIKLSSIAHEPADDVLATKVTPLDSTVLEFRRATFFVPEVGAGMIVSNVVKPKYGTNEVDGRTVVVAGDAQEKSFDAALMMNFLIRKASGPLVPMLQVGAAADEDSPTILAGAGLRLLGAKGVAFGGGWALGWVKDLDRKKLKVNDPVTGTAQIEQSLKHQFQGWKKWYFTLQYNF